MTKLQQIVSQIKGLKEEEKSELFDMLQIPGKFSGETYELSETELDELDTRLKFVDVEPTVLAQDVMQKFL